MISSITRPADGVNDDMAAKQRMASSITTGTQVGTTSSSVAISSGSRIRDDVQDLKQSMGARVTPTPTSLATETTTATATTSSEVRPGAYQYIYDRPRPPRPIPNRILPPPPPSPSSFSPSPSPSESSIIDAPVEPYVHPGSQRPNDSPCPLRLKNRPRWQYAVVIILPLLIMVIVLPIVLQPAPSPPDFEAKVRQSLIDAGVPNQAYLDRNGTSQNNALQFLAGELEREWVASGGRISSSSSDVLQKYVLAVFYFATGGEEWFFTASDSWMSSTKGVVAVCDWYNVTCNDQDNITSLVLRRSGLQGHLPGEEMALLTALEELDLSDNNLEGTLFTEIGSFSDLRILVLGKNAIEGTVPNELYGLRQLEILDLSSNAEINGTIPLIINKLESLSKYLLVFKHASLVTSWCCFTTGSLYWSQTKVSGTIPSTIGDCTLLNDLVLNDNKLEGSIPTEIGNLKLLQWFKLKDNKKMTGSIPVELTTIESLEWLDLSNGGLSGTIPNAIGSIAALKELLLKGQSISGTIPSSIGDLSQLEMFDVGNNNINGSIPPTIGNLTNLFGLVLHENKITGTVPVTLGQCTKLVTLLIVGNNIDGTVPQEVCNLRNHSLQLFEADCVREVVCPTPSCCTQCYE